MATVAEGWAQRADRLRQTRPHQTSQDTTERERERKRDKKKEREEASRPTKAQANATREKGGGEEKNILETARMNPNY